MKGKISLVDFIKEVKRELREAADTEDPFFIMGSVELEVSFVLDVAGRGSVKLLVAELGAESKATQTHKVKLTLTPYVEEEFSLDPVKEEALSQLTDPLKATPNRAISTTQQQPKGSMSHRATTQQSKAKFPPKASSPQQSQKNLKAKPSTVSANKK